MMLLIRVKSLEKLFTPESGLETISQKIKLRAMRAFIKSQEIYVYPSEENVFAIISLILVTNKYLRDYNYGKNTSREL